MSNVWGIALAVLLLLLNGFFVGAEFALVSARRSGIEPLAEAGSRRAASTLRAMENVSLMMAGAQLGITICSLALGAVSEPAIAHLLEPMFEAFGLPDGALHPAAFALALLIVTILHVVIGEMVPKNIALAGPEAAALWLGPPLQAIVHALKPLIWSLNQAANLTLRALRVQPRDEVASTVTRDEVLGVVAQSHREGMLESSEHDRLAGAIAFDAAVAADFTVPIERMHTLAPDPTVADVEALAARTGVTRFPIRVGSALGGYAHLKDTLSAPAVTSPARIRPLLRIAGDLRLSDAIEAMRAGNVHIAEVETRGRTIGIITLDDILASLART